MLLAVVHRVMECTKGSLESTRYARDDMVHSCSTFTFLRASITRTLSYRTNS